MLKKMLSKLIRGQEGAGMVEYGLLVVLVGLAAAAGLQLLGTDLGQLFTDIAGSISGATVPTIP